MAAKVNAETVEAKTMRKYYADLTKAIQDPLGLASELYSANVIARRILDSVLESNNPKVEKAMHLLQAVSDQIAVNPKDFHCFLAVLKKDSSLQPTAELISSTYRHLTQGDFEQGKDEGIMYPKRLKLSTEHDEHMSLKMKCQNIQLSWKRCSPLPETIAAGTAVVIGNKVYVSRAFPSKIYEYEILENVWSNEIECPKHLFSLAVLNEQLTLVGGGATPSSACSNILLSLIDNPTMVGTKQWSENCKPMQKKRMRPAITSNSSYFVVAGGDDPDYILATVEVMELGTQEWHAPSTLPKNDGYIGSATIIEDKLYLTFEHSSIQSLCPVVTCSLTTLVKSSESATAQGIIRPLLWQKLPEGPPLYRPRMVQLSGNLLAVGGYITIVGYNSLNDKEMYGCKGSVYVYDEENRKWILVCRLPSDKGFPDNAFSVVSLSEDKLIVIGGAHYSDDETESFPDSDIVHMGSLASTSNFPWP